MKLKLIKICAALGILGVFTGCSDNVPPPQEKQPEKTAEKKSVDSEQPSPEDREFIVGGVPCLPDDYKKDKR